jgi:sensory rhodopsin
MVELTSLFWLGAVGMAAGTAAFAWAGRNAAGGERRYYLALVGISGIAAVAYTLMANGIGWLSVADRTIFVPRYVDWILTTPLIVLFLGMLAGLDRRDFAVVIGLNTVVMVAGFAAATLPGTERFALFGLGSLAFVGLVYYLVGPTTAKAAERSAGVRSLYVRLRNLTIILWTIYPLIWILGPPGFGLLTTTVDVSLVAYLDLVTKVGFGLIALDASATMESELGESLADTDAGLPASSPGD